MKPLAAIPVTDADILARVLHRDGLMLVVDKPAGLPVHAGPKGGATLEDHFDALRFGLPTKPALAHRLDKDTSGCLVLGRHRQATARLGDLFAKGRVEKTYLAVVAGAPPEETGTIDAPLARRSHDRRSWWMRVDPSGQEATTRYRVIGSAGGVSAVLLAPETGRTHQLRVHLSHLGCPIVGDGVYGGDRARGVDRAMHLHALRVAVPMRESHPPIVVEAPVPPHMRTLVNLALTGSMTETIDSVTISKGLRA